MSLNFGATLDPYALDNNNKKIDVFNANNGGTYLLSKNLQLDTALTLNTKDTPSVINLSFGASYRIDRHNTSN